MKEPRPLSEAMAALTVRELIAFNLIRSGQATSRRQAVEMAGFSAKTKQERVFKRPNMVLAMRLANEVDSSNARMDAAALLNHLIELHRADPADLYDEDGQIKPLTDWPRALRLQVKSVKFNAFGGVEEVQMHRHLDVTAMIGKHRMVRAFVEDRQQTDRVYIVRDWTGQGLGSDRDRGLETIDVGRVLDETESPHTHGKTEKRELEGGTPPVVGRGSVGESIPPQNLTPLPPDLETDSRTSAEVAPPPSPPAVPSADSVDSGTIPRPRRAP